jgi:hypothetical protein
MKTYDHITTIAIKRVREDIAAKIARKDSIGQPYDTNPDGSVKILSHFDQWPTTTAEWVALLGEEKAAKLCDDAYRLVVNGQVNGRYTGELTDAKKCRLVYEAALSDKMSPEDKAEYAKVTFTSVDARTKWELEWFEKHLA